MPYLQQTEVFGKARPHPRRIRSLRNVQPFWRPICSPLLPNVVACTSNEIVATLDRHGLRLLGE